MITRVECDNLAKADFKLNKADLYLRLKEGEVRAGEFRKNGRLEFSPGWELTMEAGCLVASSPTGRQKIPNGGIQHWNRDEDGENGYTTSIALDPEGKSNDVGIMFKWQGGGRKGGRFHDFAKLTPDYTTNTWVISVTTDAVGIGAQKNFTALGIIVSEKGFEIVKK